MGSWACRATVAWTPKEGWLPHHVGLAGTTATVHSFHRLEGTVRIESLVDTTFGGGAWRDREWVVPHRYPGATNRWVWASVGLAFVAPFLAAFVTIEGTARAHRRRVAVHPSPASD